MMRKTNVMKKVIIIIFGLIVATISFIYGYVLLVCDFVPCDTSAYIGSGVIFSLIGIIFYSLLIFIIWIVLKLFKIISKKVKKK